MVEIKNASLSYDGAAVLNDLSLTIPAGARIALMGPSGCGKTSLLRLVAGLQAPDAGSVTAGARRIAFVFQEPRLLPRRTAAENVNVVLGDRKATLPRAREWLCKVGLADAANKYPTELSGGMRQRVNLARALAFDGDILLMDEPLSGLDGDCRAELIPLIRKCSAGKTLLLATHAIDEAKALADSIYTYADGRFQPYK